MAHDLSENKTLRAKFKSYMIAREYSVNTANTVAYNVFYLWNKRGEDVFWTAVRGDEQKLRSILRETLETYSPQRLKELNGYMTSFRFFRSFMASDEKFVTEKRAQKEKPSVTSEKELSPVLTFTEEMLEAEHQIVLNDPGYGTDYALIDSVIKRFPENTDPELVAMKIALIDMTNSTNIGRQRKKVLVTEIADIIVNTTDFDERLRQGDLSLVPIIAKCNGKINLFSFATKYCTYHSVDAYGNDDCVIFDRVVKEALPMYVPGLRLTTLEKWRSTYDYTAYKKCIDDLLDANDIHIPFRRRKLDHFLWHTYR